MVELVLREARPEDAEAIAAVQIQAWQESYADHFPPEFLASLSSLFQAETWRAIIGDGGVDVFVVESAVENTGDSPPAVIAWACATQGRDADAPADREVKGIYALRDHHGLGVGQLLLDAALGDAAAYLWIAEGNARAEAFYRRNGFARDGGEQLVHYGEHSITVVRMVRGARGGRGE